MEEKVNLEQSIPVNYQYIPCEFVKHSSLIKNKRWKGSEEYSDADILQKVHISNDYKLM